MGALVGGEAVELAPGQSSRGSTHASKAAAARETTTGRSALVGDEAVFDPKFHARVDAAARMIQRKRVAPTLIRPGGAKGIGYAQLDADGFVWGVPRDVSTFALYLNLDLIDAAGAEDPRELAANGEWTWEKFAEVSQQITENVEGAKGFGAGGWWANWGYFVNSGGGSFFNEDRTACALDTPEAIAGMEFYQGLYASGAGVPFGEDAEPPFKAGTLGMFINGRWATPGAREITDFNWDVAPLPTGPAPGNNWQFWGAYVINANTADPAAAWKLVEALTSVEVQSKISELGANIPSRQSQDAIDAFLTYTPPANNQAFVDGITNDPVAEGPLWQGNWLAQGRCEPTATWKTEHLQCF
jgi:multiple sugar transport system substrate-binding protein